MRLTESQVAAVERQTEAMPIPEDNPAIEQLRGAFGDHTFYADANGLHVMESLGDEGEETDESRIAIVQVAEWTDADKSSLAPVEPRALGTIDLSDDGAGSGGDDAA